MIPKAMLLDPNIRAWMLLPIFFITNLSTLLRQGLSELNQRSTAAVNGQGGPPSPSSMFPGSKATFVDTYTTSVTTSSKLVRAAATTLTTPSLLARKRHFLGKNEDGKLCKPPKGDVANPFQSMMSQDPSKMAGAMKYNVLFLVLNGGLAYLISYLFSECVVAKTPFPLTRTFKGILQRGIEVEDLDPTYVSGLSWYFLILFCSASYSYLVNNALGLVKGPAVSALEAMDPIMGTMMSSSASSSSGAAAFGGSDPAKIFGQEADHWKLMSPVPFLDGVEKNALAVLRST